jgi:hypothetical protein
MERKVTPCPNHFTKTSTPLTDESKLWIYERLAGRFSFDTSTFFADANPLFEDPKEAMMYELAWG